MIVVGSMICACLIAFTSAHPLLDGYCGKAHEVYKTCGSPCAPTCRNLQPSYCEPQCQTGCFCEDGFVRDDNGFCVYAKKCHRNRRQKCSSNEKFKKCKRTCEATCKHSKPKECSEPCIDYGCQCKSGFVRDKYGDCIPKDMCQNKEYCGKNQYYSNDTYVPAVKCQPRCSNHKPSKACPLYFTSGGCVCKTGYLRTYRGKCVQEKDCDDSSSTRSRSTESDSDDSTRSDSDSEYSDESTDEKSSDCSDDYSSGCRKKCRGNSCSSESYEYPRYGKK